MTQTTCSISGCNGTLRARGWCYAHWRRWKRHGDPLAGKGIVQQPDKERCSIEGCGDLAYSGSWCLMHYTRNLRHGDPHYVKKHWGQGECSVDGCGRDATRRGWCEKHYTRWRLKGSPTFPMPKPKERLGNGDGYVMLYRPDHPAACAGRVPEHRWVMEQELGRALLPTETVHHLNGERDDNRLENLELWSSSHPPGQRVVDKVKWAKELLALYG